VWHPAEDYWPQAGPPANAADPFVPGSGSKPFENCHALLSPEPQGGPQAAAVVVASGQAAVVAGGLWLCSWRWPSGLVAVVVPSACRVMVQPWRWMAVRWW